MSVEPVKNQELKTIEMVITVCAVTFGVFLLGTGFFYAVQNMSAAPSTISTPRTGTDADFIVARVNGSVIRFSDVIMAKNELPDVFESLPREAVYDALVEQLIARRLLAEEAWRAGIEQEAVTQSRLNFEREKVLRDLYMVELIEGRITDKQVNTLYEEVYLAPEALREVRLQQILVRTEPEAKAAYEVLESGVSFEDVARQVSIDASAVKGGELGFLTRDRVVGEVAARAFLMEVGEVSRPIKSRFGFHIIKLLEKREKAPPPIDSVRESLRLELVQMIMDAELDKLRGRSRVERYDLPSATELDRAVIASQ